MEKKPIAFYTHLETVKIPNSECQYVYKWIHPIFAKKSDELEWKTEKENFI